MFKKIILLILVKFMSCEIDNTIPITNSFINGSDIEALSRKFECTKSTIIRNLKKSLGEDEYSNLIVKYKSDKEISEINKFFDESFRELIYSSHFCYSFVIKWSYMFF